MLIPGWWKAFFKYMLKESWMIISLQLDWFFKVTSVWPNAKMVHHVDCLVLGAVLLALYLVSSLDQTSSSSVVDKALSQYIAELSWTMFTRPSKFQGLFIVCARVTMTFAAKASITWPMEKFASWTTVQKRQGPKILPTIIPAKVYMNKFRKRG